MAGVHELLFGCVGAGEEDVLADGAVEEEGVLEDNAELIAVAGEPDGGEVDAVDQNFARGGGVECADERDDGRLAGARGADEGGDGARGGLEAYAVKDFLTGLVGEGYVVEGDVSTDGGECDGAGRLGVFFLLVEDLGGAIEAGYGFSELRADGDELHDRHGHEGEEHDVG